MTAAARPFRIAVLALAAFYFVERFTVETWTLDSFGWQFRYLTVWGLTLNLLCAALMVTDRYGQPDGPGAVLVALASVLNAIVVASYWRLYLQDPTLVNGGREIVPWREWYLHALGPALQLADALLLKRALRRMAAVATALGAVVLLYLAWAELIVAPLNDRPVGQVTSGLPYPFLNDMTLAARMGFYAATWASGLVFLVGLRALQGAVDRWLPARPECPPSSSASTADRPER